MVLVVKKLLAHAGDVMYEVWVGSLVREVPWRRERQPTPVFFPGECHGQRSLPGYSPWGCKGSDMTEAT